MNLENLEIENKKYLKKFSKKKIFPIIGVCFILVIPLLSFDFFKTNFIILFIPMLIALVIIGIIISQFSNLEKKDKLLDDFFYDNHLMILEKMRKINNRNSFEFSKEHLSEIIKNISYNVMKFRHTDDIEYVERLPLDEVYYEITYEIVKNESQTDIFQVYKIKKRVVRTLFSDYITKEYLPLDLINSLYRIRKSKKNKPEKAFKIIRITGKTAYSS